MVCLLLQSTTWHVMCHYFLTAGINLPTALYKEKILPHKINRNFSSSCSGLNLVPTLTSTAHACRLLFVQTGKLYGATDTWPCSNCFNLSTCQLFVSHEQLTNCRVFFFLNKVLEHTRKEIWKISRDWPCPFQKNHTLPPPRYVL